MDQWESAVQLSPAQMSLSPAPARPPHDAVAVLRSSQSSRPTLSKVIIYNDNDNTNNNDNDNDNNA